MALPRKFVDEIHLVMLMRYGSRWVSMWHGVPEELVKADWATQLDGMTPAAIRAALANLPPDFPPTCTAFRKLGEANVNRVPDAREVLRLQDERGGGKPSPERLARLRVLRAMLSVAVKTESDHA